jgi:maltose/moltooligosaccharide transporter
MILSNSKWIYFSGMTLMGFAWGSIVAIPYLMIADAVSPARMGVYMGLINAFICVPQFIGMLTVPLFYKTILGDDPRNALLLCGLCLFAAAIACFWVKEDVKAYIEPVVT